MCNFSDLYFNNWEDKIMCDCPHKHTKVIGFAVYCSDCNEYLGQDVDVENKELREEK